MAALTCDVPTTILAIQPSIHASDFTNDAAPLFKQTVESAGTKLVVPYGHGTIDTEELIVRISEQCHAVVERIDATHGSHPLYTGDGIARLLVVTFGLVPETQGRTEALNEHGKRYELIAQADNRCLSSFAHCLVAQAAVQPHLRLDSACTSQG